MARYVLRYFFDPGSGICLWSANDEARKRFDYPVQLTELGLSENLLRQAIYVMAWHDTSLDWSNPPNSSWPDSERIRFQQASKNLLAMLREALGPKFEIRDESS
jgi:hypothetical protein